MPDTTEALSADNRESLNRLAAQAQIETRWLKVAALSAIVAAALLLAALRTVTPDLYALPQTLMAVLGGGGLLLFGWLQVRRRRLWKPLQQALGQGHKQVRRGRLSEVEALGNGRLRYVIDGQAMDLRPLAGPLQAHPLPEGAAIRDLQALRDVEVALHWVARGQDRLLLEWHMLNDTPASSSARPRTEHDLHSAHRPARQLLRFFTLLVPVVALLAAALAGFDARVLWTALAVGATACVLMIGLSRRLAARRRQEDTLVHTLTGTLSERFCTVSRIGNRPAHTWLWYRIGGQLLQVDAPIAGVRLGERLMAEYLVQSQAPASGGPLLRLTRVTPAGPADQAREHEAQDRTG